MGKKKDETELRTSVSLSVTAVREVWLPAKVAKEWLAERLSERCGFKIEPSELEDEIYADGLCTVLNGFSYRKEIEKLVEGAEQAEAALKELAK